MAAVDRARVKAIFAEVADAPAGQRGALLDRLCDGDDAVRSRVVALLAADERAGTDGAGFLDEPAIAGATSLAREALGDAPEPVGEIGAFRIVGKIGEGGMGAVYEAEQQAPKRPVALKLIRAGAATPALQRRLRREAQALGRLSHRGIARVYSAGSAPVSYSDGSQATAPFIAMELVRGDTLLQHAKSHDLDDRARLELLAAVADAMQYAHQNGVIHRDLKPANILVTSEGNPKILDFGVARLVDTEQDGSLAQTLHGQLIGTLAYMSPEQIAGDPAKIDTRCDVYALGVIGYELLSGKPPLEVGSTSLAHAARVIMETEPRSLGAAAPRLRGDVATIIDKALEKERDERYGSAAEFAADLRRYLRSEPIEARPHSAAYLVRKFAARNKALVAATAVIVVALIAATTVSSVMAVRANRQRIIAEREALRSETAASFMRQMLGSVNPGVARENDTTLLRTILDDTWERLQGGELAGEPVVELDLLDTISGVYGAIAEYDRAIEIHQRAIALGTEHLGPTHPSTRRARHGLATVYMATGRIAEAEELLESLRRDMIRALGAEHDDVVGLDATLGSLYAEQGRYEEAAAALEHALEGRVREYGPESSQAVSTMNSLAGAYSHLDRLEESVALYERVIEASRVLVGDDHPNIAMGLNNLATAYNAAGRRDEGEAAAREAIDIQRRVLGNSHPSLGMSLHTLASLLLESGRASDSEALYREALAIFERALPPNHWFILQTRLDVGRAMAGGGDFEIAIAEMAGAYDGFEAAFGAEHARTRAAAGEIVKVCEAWLEASPTEAGASEADRWRTLAGNG